MTSAPLITEVVAHRTPEEVARGLLAEPGLVLLRTSWFESPGARYSFIAARPFLRFRCHGSCCEVEDASGGEVRFGDPWRILESLISTYELLDEVDQPFPLGGCFGYFGYELKTFIEPRLGRRADVDLQLADCDIGFYDSLLVFDHLLDRSWIISTGFQSGGTRSGEQAREQVAFWRCALERDPGEEPLAAGAGEVPAHLPSSLSRPEFVARVKRAQDYIRAGDVYQVNLSHRFSAPFAGTGWDLFSRLNAVSPAPHAAFLKAMDSCLVSASPELFLRWSGRQVQTRPIKGTRPRSADAERDAQLAFELLTSPKENAELVMITDLLRNDLGKVCEFGSVRVPELARLERFPHVQHLVSTVEGRLRPGVSHLQALAACFPGGSITGAPKVRAMEIIDELEPVARGPYTGALGYLGFNQESQLSILIRSAVLKNGVAFFNVGAGIVADSDPEAEYEETVAKAAGMISALRAGARRNPTSPNPWPAF